eukprot:PhM_4_TR15689/c0_g1_i1/m.307
MNKHRGGDRAPGGAHVGQGDVDEAVARRNRMDGRSERRRHCVPDPHKHASLVVRVDDREVHSRRGAWCCGVGDTHANGALQVQRQKLPVLERQTNNSPSSFDHNAVAVRDARNKVVFPHRRKCNCARRQNCTFVHIQREVACALRAGGACRGHEQNTFLGRQELSCSHHFQWHVDAHADNRRHGGHHPARDRGKRQTPHRLCHGERQRLDKRLACGRRPRRCYSHCHAFFNGLGHGYAVGNLAIRRTRGDRALCCVCTRARSRHLGRDDDGGTGDWAASIRACLQCKVNVGRGRSHNFVL